MKRSHLSQANTTNLLSFVAATFMLILSCSKSEPQPSAPEPNTTDNSSAPPTTMTSQQMVASDPRGQYRIIKQSLDTIVPEPPEPTFNEVYYLEDCKSARDYMGGIDDPMVAGLTEVAQTVIHLNKVLTKLGYPDSVWKTQLDEFETQHLNRFLEEPNTSSTRLMDDQEAFKLRLARDLNEYRERESPELPEVSAEPGCGEGEVSIRLVTNPVGGRPELIPVFFYEVCKAQQLDPENSTQCNRWITSPEGTTIEVAGDFFVRASWPDGVARTSRMTFGPEQDGATITITR